MPEDKEVKGVFFTLNREQRKIWGERAKELGFVKDGKPLYSDYIRGVVQSDLENKITAKEIGKLKDEFVLLRRENKEIRQINISLQRALSQAMFNRESEVMRKALSENESIEQGLLTKEEWDKMAAEQSEMEQIDEVWETLNNKEKEHAHNLMLDESISVMEAVKRIKEGIKNEIKTRSAANNKI